MGRQRHRGRVSKREREIQSQELDRQINIEREKGLFTEVENLRRSFPFRNEEDESIKIDFDRNARTKERHIRT